LFIIWGREHGNRRGGWADFKYSQLKLGTIRLTQMFRLDKPDDRFPRHATAWSATTPQRGRSHGRAAQQHRFQVTIGTAGTIRNLAGIATLRAGRSSNGNG